MKENENVWVLIPARGGSKGIPHKNVKMLAGRPLIQHVLEEFNGHLPQSNIIVSTDDESIAAVANPFATIHPRNENLAGDATTLDEVAVDVAEWLIRECGAAEDDCFITVQPTSPFIQFETLKKGVETLQSGKKSVISVKDDRHLRWTKDAEGNPAPMFEARLNRQWLPSTFGETGGVIGSRIGDLLEQKTRIIQPVGLLEIGAQEGLDIDTFADWAIAEYYANRKTIVIRADAGANLGMGHVYRTLALAQELSANKLIIVTRNDGEYKLGAEFLASHHYKVIQISAGEDFVPLLEKLNPDITILDILDTEVEFVKSVKKHSKFVVSLEDLGTGSHEANIVINDLYTDLYPHHNHWYGVEFAILAPHFDHAKPVLKTSTVVKQVLVTFGGTDPENLTVKALEALQQIGYAGEVTVVLGPGYNRKDVDLRSYNLKGIVRRSVKNMAILMQKADLAITSAGRTVTELMILGVPTVVACQNLRELRHTHAASPFGVVNLGLGKHLEAKNLAYHVQMLLDQPELRADMRQRALQAVKNRSNRQIVDKIIQAADKNKA